jgi:membrane fusion protein (multidrug efflux system)
MTFKYLKPFLTIFALGSVLFLSHPAQAQGGPSQPTPVIVTEVKQDTIYDSVEALGTLQADENGIITTTVTELVTKIHFEDNQTVKQGDILVEMDATEEQAELTEQQSVLAEAQKQVDRLSPLVKRGAASQSTLDENIRDVASATARMNAIQSRIDQRIIRAPYDGVLGLRNISVGALIQPGTEITTIDDVSTMKLDFSIPDLFMSSLRQGTVIEARSESYPDKVFNGVVNSIGSRIDPVTRTLMVRALIDNQDGLLKPGLLMRVEVQKNNRTTLIIPEESLIIDGADNFVFVLNEEKEPLTVDRRKVTLGTRQFGEVEIVDGLSAGEKIVTHGVLRLRPGAEISITSTEKNNEPLTTLLNNQDQD